MLTCLTVAMTLSACSGDSMTSVVLADQPLETIVSDLAVTTATESSVTVEWTEIDDGTGAPAGYSVRYAEGPIDWSTASSACQSVPGTEVGAEASCTIAGLDASSDIEVQLKSYSLQDGVMRNARYSNVVRGRTGKVGSSAPVVSDLAVSAVTDSSVTVAWTQIDDGTGSPATYRVKYASPTLSWSSGEMGCSQVTGTEIGSPASCTITGLTPSSQVEVQLMSYRIVDGLWQDAQYSNVVSGVTADAGSASTLSGVTDLSVVDATGSTLTVTWTQVGDGSGSPASYRVKYAVPSISFGSATTACSRVLGDAIGSKASCTIEGLAEDTEYDVQLMSFRIEDGVWVDSVRSNVATARTSGSLTAQATGGIWISKAEISALPMSGAAWNNLLATADGSCGSVDLANQDQNNNVCVMAKALAYARTGQTRYLSGVLAAISEVVAEVAYDGRALALGRELAAYVIAADIVDLGIVDPTLDAAFRVAIRRLMTTFTNSGPASLVECHEVRPNNWGTHCGGSRAVVAAYLGDAGELARVAQVFKGWLGDRSSYAGFRFGDLAWQCDGGSPVAINPAGCTRDGHDIGGVLPDDQRRAGGFTWPAPHENYVWEALQGALVQAIVLQRAGYPAFQWGNQALRRAAEWLYNTANFPAEGDDTWQPYVLNHYYGTNFPTASTARPGKNVGWTDWTLGG